VFRNKELLAEVWACCGAECNTEYKVALLLLLFVVVVVVVVVVVAHSVLANKRGVRTFG
jgi:hypothetical protein